MSQFRVPLNNPKPQIGRFIDTLTGKLLPEKPPLEEYLIDNAVMRPILEGMLGRKWIETSDKAEYMGGQMDFNEENRDLIDRWLDNQIAFWYHMGYDFVRVEVSLPLPAISHVTKDTAQGNETFNRAWQGLEPGVIQTWDDFERYPWPEVTDRCFYIHEYICKHLPEGMGFLSCHAGGVYEHASRLMGYEGLCLALYDNRELVKAVADRLGDLILRYNEHLVQLPNFPAVFQGEDFGFNTGTLLAPDDIREFFLPWHRRYSQIIHDAGKLYFLHSCGKVDNIMKDLVDDVKIDGKHSFQDDVVPVWEFQKQWGDRIAVLGGIDVHKLATLGEKDLRRYVRKVIDSCAPRGRFAVGAGNSIPSYVPVENYLTMIDEALN